jgi:hypothetical protein
MIKNQKRRKVIVNLKSKKNKKKNEKKATYLRMRREENA